MLGSRSVMDNYQIGTKPEALTLKSPIIDIEIPAALRCDMVRARGRLIYGVSRDLSPPASKRIPTLRLQATEYKTPNGVRFLLLIDE